MSEMQKAGPNHETGPHENVTTANSTYDQSDILAAASGYCVLVESAHGRHRRRLYLSLSAAENAVERAKANGKWAALVLAVVTPVGVIA